jgi:hypothetical protein
MAYFTRPTTKKLKQAASSWLRGLGLRLPAAP